jgi:hypothetical protein
VEYIMILAAMSAPLVAGVGVVAWSKARAAARARRLAALDAEVAGLYRTVEGRPVPERLALVVEALDEADAMKAAPPVPPPRTAVPA